MVLEEVGNLEGRVPEVDRGKGCWVGGAVEEVDGGLRGGVAVGTQRRGRLPYFVGVRT